MKIISVFWLSVFCFININSMNRDGVKKFEFTPLHFISYSNPDLLDFLPLYTNNGIIDDESYYQLTFDLDALDSYKQTPFFWALLAPNINMELISFLLENLSPVIGAGALDFDYSCIVPNILKKTDQNENSILHLAVIYKKLDLIEFFVKNGANFSIENIDGKNPIQLIIDSKNKCFISECFNLFSRYNANLSGIEVNFNIKFEKVSLCNIF